MSRPFEDKWVLGERIGKGGQGLAYHVTSRSDPSQKAALKLLKNNKDDQARSRMYREVANLKTLHSDGGSVPQVVDHNTDKYEDKNTELYLVMEYIPGKTLRETVDAGTLPLDIAAKIVLKIAETIKTAHKSPILHRDLKPENVIVRHLETADVVIIDYGLSFNAEIDKDVTDTEETFRNKFLDLPETNTPGGNKRDPRSDITAACGILYYMLTGQVPGQLIDGGGKQPHVRPGYSIRERIKDHPRLSHLEIFLDCGFASNVENRFQTVDEFVERLRVVLEHRSTAEIEDPIEVGKRESVRYRQLDRKTQLRDFSEIAGRVVNQITAFVAKYAGKIGRFNLETLHAQLDQPGGEDSVRLTVPSEIDRVPQSHVSIKISPTNSSNFRVLYFFVGSRGEQCVICRAKYKKTTQTGSRRRPQWIHNIEAVEDCREVQWYKGDTMPELSEIENECKSWLNDSMRELTDDLVRHPTLLNDGASEAPSNW